MIEREIKRETEKETEREIEREIRRTKKEPGAEKERGIVKKKTEIRSLLAVIHLLEREKGRKLETEALGGIDLGALVPGKGVTLILWDICTVR